MAEFFREGLEGMLYMLQQLENAGVSFHSYTEPGLSSDKGLLAVITALAAQERAWRSEQTKIGMQRARERGKQIGRRESRRRLRRGSEPRWRLGTRAWAGSRVNLGLRWAQSTVSRMRLRLYRFEARYGADNAIWVRKSLIFFAIFHCPNPV